MQQSIRSVSEESPGTWGWREKRGHGWGRGLGHIGGNIRLSSLLSRWVGPRGSGWRSAVSPASRPKKYTGAVSPWTYRSPPGCSESLADLKEKQEFITQHFSPSLHVCQLLMNQKPNDVLRSRCYNKLPAMQVYSKWQQAWDFECVSVI